MPNANGRITESELLHPTLTAISELSKATVAQLQAKLLVACQPSGEDLEILHDRKDTKFSQKVRNFLTCHKSLLKTGCVQKIPGKTQGEAHYVLTDAGVCFLKNPKLFFHIRQQGFSDDIQKESFEKIAQHAKGFKAVIYGEAPSENTVVKEGEHTVSERKKAYRDAKFKSDAVDYFKKQSPDGTLSCSCCNFSYSNVYGGRGKDYIIIHHLKPLFQYKDEDRVKFFSEAIKNTAPVCSNCHDMIHRKKNNILSIEQMHDILAKTKRTSPCPDDDRSL
jgi:hypothetical protein